MTTQRISPPEEGRNKAKGRQLSGLKQTQARQYQTAAVDPEQTNSLGPPTTAANQDFHVDHELLTIVGYV